MNVGRPGMTLWRILVLGTLRLGDNKDFDSVHELANQHILYAKCCFTVVMTNFDIIDKQ